jgi:hypothetical protein
MSEIEKLLAPERFEPDISCGGPYGGCCGTMEPDAVGEYVRYADYAALLDELARRQAKIDALMLEFCPGEMTPEQVENWTRHQGALSTSGAKGE